jgi:hypothetical protein
MGFSVGDRVALVSTGDEYTNLKPGDEGIVDYISKMPPYLGGGTQVCVTWDNGSNLAMLIDDPMSGDRLRKVGE